MKIHFNRSTLTRCIGSTLTAASLAACAAGPATDAGALYRAHKAALSRGDVDTAMSLLSDDVTYIAGPNCTPTQPCVGKDAVRKGFVDYAVARKMTIVPIGASEDSTGTARTLAEVRWPGIDQLGVERLRGHDVAEVKGGKLASVVFTPDLSDAQTMKVYRPTPAKP